MRYAKQLSDEELQILSFQTEGMSGRNISDICKGKEFIKDAERRWASKIIRKEKNEDLPDVHQYLETIESRKL